MKNNKRSIIQVCKYKVPCDNLHYSIIRHVVSVSSSHKPRRYKEILANVPKSCLTWRWIEGKIVIIDGYNIRKNKVHSQC